MELVIVIAVLGILASVAIPRMINLKDSAIKKSEDSLIASMKTAINNEYLANINRGLAPDDAWPCNPNAPTSDSRKPFDLLSTPTQHIDSFTAYTSDGRNWMQFNNNNPNIYVYIIYCPHYYGNGVTDGQRGRSWIYCYKNPGYNCPGYGQMKAGDFVQLFNNAF